MTDESGVAGDEASPGTPTATDVGRPSATRTTGLVAGIFLLSTAAAAYEIAPASVIPLVRESLGVGPTAAGWLVSVMYATAVAASVPVGVVLDRVNVRGAVVAAGLALLVAGGWGWSAATAGDYPSLLASRALAGLAYVVIWNAGADIVGRSVGPARRATAVGVFTASAPAGFALGQFGAPLIAAPLGWPAVLPAYAALGAVGVPLFAIATWGQQFGVQTAAPDRTSFRRLFRNGDVWLLCVLCFLAFALYLFLNTWLPSYLTEELGVSLAVGGLVTAVFPAVGIVSRIGGGALSDRVFGGRRRPVAVLSFGLTAPVVTAFVVLTAVPVVVALVAVTGFAIQLAIGLLFSYIAEVVTDEVRSTAISLLTAVGLLGAFLAPVVAGAVIERAGYRPAFVLAGLVALLGVLVALRAPETP